MRKLAWLACLWPAAACAQTELVSLLLWGAVALALCWAGFAALVALMLFARPRNRAVAFLVVLVLPIGWWKFVTPAISEHAQASQTRDQAVVRAASDYVAAACARGLPQASYAPVVGRDGLRIDSAPAAMKLAGVPPMEPYSALTHWWRGETASRASLERRHERQYERALSWPEDLTTFFGRSPFLASTPFAFVEWWDFDAYRAHALARFDWWTASGWRRLTQQEEARFERDRLTKANLIRPESVRLYDVVDLQSRYILSADDISTLADRQHWVARGRLKLHEGADGPTVAEYVLFSVYSSPSQPTSGVWLPMSCPGREAVDYAAISGWQERREAPFRHFLNDVVQYVPTDVH